MTLYVKVSDGEVEQYSISRLRKDNPNISFPRDASAETLAEYGVFELQTVTAPEATRENKVVEGPPVFANGWRQSWTLVPRTAEEIEKWDDDILQFRKLTRLRPESLLKALEEVVRLLSPDLDGLPPERTLALAPLFPDWSPNTSYSVGDVLNYNGVVLKVVQEHTSQADWLPDNLPALYTAYREPGAVTPWVQPTGAQDAYQIGDKVSYEGSVWVSTAANNVWAPGVFGWVKE